MTIETKNDNNIEKNILPIIILLYALFIFSIPFETLGGQEGTTFSFTKLIGYVFLISCILFQPKLCFGKPPKAFWLFVIYLIIYAFMGFFQPASYQTEIITRGVTTAQMLILMLVSFNLMKNKRVFQIALVSLIISCGLAAIMQFGGITATEYGADRFSFLGEDPNVAGSVLAIGAVALIGLILTLSLTTKIKFILSCVLLPIIWAIVLTGSRGAIVALAAGMLIFAFSKGNMKIKVRSTIMIMLISGVLVWFSMQYMTTMQRWESTLSEGSMAMRELIYPAALGMFIEKPFLGWGPLNHAYELGSVFGLNIIDTHNLYLWILTEVGLIGSIPFFWGLWLCVKSAWIAWRRDNFVVPFALLVTVLTIGMSITPNYRKVFWIVLAIALAASLMNGTSGVRQNRLE
jgi:O-antigen ligase